METEGVHALGRKQKDVVEPYSPRVEEEKSEVVENKKSLKDLGKPILVVINIGIHSGIVGITMGLSEEKDFVINLMVAVLVHKWADAACVGLCVEKYSPHWIFSVILVTINALVTPVMIGVGMLLTGSNSTVTTSLNALGVGFLVYLGASDVFNEEISRKPLT